MPLSIQLGPRSASHPIWTAGDQVSGSVVLFSDRDEAVGSVQITFLGRAKTKIRRQQGQSSTVYRGRAEYFRYATTLYTGKFTLRAGEYTWPFSFTFPDIAIPGAQEAEWKEHGGFITAAHPLPPTFATSHRGFRGDYDCFVEYKLEASLTRPPESYVLYSRGLEAEQRLPYSPIRAEVDPEPRFAAKTQTISHASLLLLPENEGRSLTLKEKTRAIFKTSDLPRATFAITADLPQVICDDGHLIPAFVGLEYVPEISTAPHVPVVTLQSWVLKMAGVTSARAPRYLSFTGEVVEKSCSKVYEEEARKLDIPFTRRMNLREHYTYPIGGDTPPSFSTYNICRGYQLELKLVVQIAEKEFTVQFPPQPVLVLPKYHDVARAVAEAQERRENAQVGNIARTEEALPQYTPHDPGSAVEGPDLESELAIPPYQPEQNDVPSTKEAREHEIR